MEQNNTQNVEKIVAAHKELKNLEVRLRIYKARLDSIHNECVKLDTDAETAYRRAADSSGGNSEPVFYQNLGELNTLLARLFVLEREMLKKHQTINQTEIKIRQVTETIRQLTNASQEIDQAEKETQAAIDVAEAYNKIDDPQPQPQPQPQPTKPKFSPGNWIRLNAGKDDAEDGRLGRVITSSNHSYFGPFGPMYEIAWLKKHGSRWIEDGDNSVLPEIALVPATKFKKGDIVTYDQDGQTKYALVIEADKWGIKSDGNHYSMWQLGHMTDIRDGVQTDVWFKDKARRFFERDLTKTSKLDGMEIHD